MKLFHILQNENTNVEQVEKVISTDPAMAAKIIRLANSPFYRHCQQPLGMHQSLLTIGLDMVKCIVLSMAVMESFNSSSKRAVHLWKHSYAVALMVLSMGLDKQEKETLFTGALLHDLGRMVFLYKVPSAYIPLFDFEGNRPDIGLEQDVFQTDHTIIGEAVAKKWHFPDEIIGIIKNHHMPNNRASALIFLINTVINELEKDQPCEIDQYSRMLTGFLGKSYKDLVNTIIHRYKTNTVIIENMF
ncbi:MAG: HDOD domain-containing protein [Deltaproteobacteria bacterium]|nr:HDOD domain-containing protein [Deltaproteobacteria bacterium]